MLGAAGGALLYCGRDAQGVLERLGRRTSNRGRRGILIKRSVVIRRPPAEVYRFWRDLGNLPQFLEHLASMTPVDERRSHWAIRIAGGRIVAWDAEIIDDLPNRDLIVWRSLPESEVENEGSVRFWPVLDEQATRVEVLLRYRLPGGRLGALVARLLSEAPEDQISDDLERLRRILDPPAAITVPASTWRPRRRGTAPALGRREAELLLVVRRVEALRGLEQLVAAVPGHGPHPGQEPLLLLLAHGFEAPGDGQVRDMTRSCGSP